MIGIHRIGVSFFSNTWQILWQKFHKYLTQRFWNLKNYTEISNSVFLADVFAGAKEKVLETSSEVGGYAGVIGGMMGEVFANGAPSQGKLEIIQLR